MDNLLNDSSIYSSINVSTTHHKSMLILDSLYSFLGADQVMAIQIKSQERLTLSVNLTVIVNPAKLEIHQAQLQHYFLNFLY